MAKRGEDAGTSLDVDAYDLILRDKETLLSLPAANDDEVTRLRKQVRFIFSHSALREGWDNPNVFVICTLKHSDSTVSRRQEVGRGMRLCVNQHGERMDHPATAHDINVLTVVANESYEDFVKGLQSDIHDSLSARPRKANEGYFTGKVLAGVNGEDDKTLTPELAKQIYRYLLKHDYSDDQDQITDAYHQAKKDCTLAELPEDLQLHAPQVFQLIDSVFSEGALPQFGNNRAPKRNLLNENFHKKEFQDLWRKINHRAAYTVALEISSSVSKATV